MVKKQLRKLYHVLPAGFRKGLASFGPTQRLRDRLFSQHTGLHDEYYSADYFAEEIFAIASKTAPMFARSTIEKLGMTSIVDVGCGTGDNLKAFVDAGVVGHGVDLAQAAIELCRQKGLDVVQMDLSSGRDLPWQADLVYSIEVAEHIGEQAAPKYVRMLTDAAKRHVILTAAPPGQPGLCHVNCQPKEYWIKLFHNQGFHYDAELTSSWEAENKEGAYPIWFSENFMVFRRNGMNDK